MLSNNKFTWCFHKAKLVPMFRSYNFIWSTQGAQKSIAFGVAAIQIGQKTVVLTVPKTLESLAHLGMSGRYY